MRSYLCLKLLLIALLLLYLILPTIEANNKPVTSSFGPGKGNGPEEEEETLSLLDIDELYMSRAIELASRTQGRTSPNPCVGCVIVSDDGTVVGEGYHVKVGEAHAEVVALRAAGDKSMGCTAYVSLEPCNHHGRTPPCTEALCDAGIKRVVAGMVDPDPRVSGNGLAFLRQHGLDVSVGICEQKCRDLNRPFIFRVLNQRSYANAWLLFSDLDHHDHDSSKSRALFLERSLKVLSGQFSYLSLESRTILLTYAQLSTLLKHMGDFALLQLLHLFDESLTIAIANSAEEFVLIEDQDVLEQFIKQHGSKWMKIQSSDNNNNNVDKVTRQQVLELLSTEAGADSCICIAHSAEQVSDWCKDGFCQALLSGAVNEADSQINVLKVSTAIRNLLSPLLDYYANKDWSMSNLNRDNIKRLQTLDIDKEIESALSNSHRNNNKGIVYESRLSETIAFMKIHLWFN